MMDVELKSKWVAALRSGKYKQGRNYLKVGDCYCCLGVLCEISGLEYGRSDSGDYSGFKDKEGSAYSMYLPPDFNPIGGEDQTHVALMNDVDKKSFNEIADYIEENL